MSTTHVLTRTSVFAVDQICVGDAIRFSLAETTGGRYNWKISNDPPGGDYVTVPGMTHDGPDIETTFRGFTFLEGSPSDDVNACVLECLTPGKFAISLHYTAGSDRTDSSSGYDLYLYVRVAPGG